MKGEYSISGKWRNERAPRARTADSGTILTLGGVADACGHEMGASGVEVPWPLEERARLATGEYSLTDAKSRSRGISTTSAQVANWRVEFARMVEMNDEQLAQCDLGHLNLTCGQQLPGSEGVDIVKCRRTLDTWAELVRLNTDHWWSLYTKAPAAHDNSPGRFRMLALVTVLQKHLGVRYRRAFSEDEYDATDSRDLFIYGLLSGHQGTCVTMPILYIAIGRRLGYPLKLVEAKEHLFARWEEPGGERFNIECTSPGFVSHGDAYYHKQPRPLSPAELRQGTYLRNLSPREELAVCLYERASCLRDNLRVEAALEALYWADQMAPDHPSIRGAWAITTLMARAMDRTRHIGGQEGRNGVSLCELCWPTPSADWERWALPHAREHMKRIFHIHGRKRAESKRQVH